MRVFKIGLGVLAVMLGLAGSVKAESMPDKDIVETAAQRGPSKPSSPRFRLRAWWMRSKVRDR